MTQKLGKTVLDDACDDSREVAAVGNVNQKEDAPTDVQNANNINNIMTDPLGMSREVRKM